MTRFLSFFTLCFLGMGSQCLAQDILAEIQDIRPEMIKVEGFRLNSSDEVEITAVGFRTRRDNLRFTNAWILDSQTREVVWELEDGDADRKNRRLVEFKDSVSLPKGDYEVYYSSFPFDHWRSRGRGNFFERLFDEIFDGDEYDDLYDDYRDEWREFNIVVRGDGRRYDEEDLAELRKSFEEGVFISMTGLRGDEYLRQGFKLERPMDIRIYAIGEAKKEGTYDYGWIIDTKTREKVWKFTYRDSEHAGGTRKNRMVNETISLPAGNYLALFVTDDTHSSGDWNASPPYDPTYWGLTLKAKNAQNVQLIDYDKLSQENAIVSLTRVGDDEFLSEGFTLNRGMNLRIYALGEGRRKEMFDFGWIVDTNTHKKIWEMDYYNTEHAGGGDKNRLYDKVIKFKKGSYVVYYVSDDSHSYWDFNTGAPYDQENWGITISAADEDFKSSDVSEYEESSKVLVKLVGMRDHERERERFVLDKDGDVRIYAIGEGSDGSMYDYGWIEDADTRGVVWEMTYRRTDHAGGAKKNRLFDETISLKKGEYVVYYESDGSHSSEYFNSAPPYDPNNWGITVYLVDNR